MLKLIATNGGMTLFQTGFTVVFEGTFLEESFPSGHIIDEEGELIPVPKIDSVINSPYWSVIEMPDEPLGKGRKRQFASRSEAGRYAARIRWGNTSDGPNGPNGPTGNPLPVAATFDINEAIATGAPYAPFLEENFPDDVKNALAELELSGETNGIGPASQKALMALEIHYEKHLDPKNLSAETQETSRLAGEKGNSFYSQFSVVPDIDRSAESRNIYRAKQRKDLASDMAREHVKLQLERKYVKDTIGEEDALAYTKAVVASPSMRIAVAVHGVNVVDILNNGFKNQFETGESSGMNNPARRATHEAIAYGIHPATVASRRPIYANLHPVGTQVTEVNGSRQYGSIQFVVKQSVHDRATFSVTDSLGQVRNAASVKGPIKKGQAHPNGIQKGTYNDPINISKRARNGETYPYAEAQVQQGLKISDIAYVAIPKRGRLPTGAPALLKKLGIKVVRIDDRDPLNDSAVIKSATVNLQQTLDLISEVVAKATTFNGNRSAAGQYAARIRWGNRGSGGLPPHLEAIAQQSEAAYVPMQEGTLEEQTLKSLVESGFEGNGPPPTFDPVPSVPETKPWDSFPPHVKDAMIAAGITDNRHWTGEGISPKNRVLMNLGIEGISMAGPRPSEDKMGTSSTITYNPKGPNTYTTIRYIPTKQQYDMYDKWEEAVNKRDSVLKSNREKLNAWIYPAGASEKEKQKIDGKIAVRLGNHHGFHRGAQTVGAQDFDALAKSGRFVVVWRGGTKEQISSLSTRHPHIGGGEGGLGTYTAFASRRASEYGDLTPMLIPKVALGKGKMEYGAWGLRQSDPSGYYSRASVSHSRSERKFTADLVVHNTSILIVGPRHHDPTKLLGDLGTYEKSVEDLLGVGPTKWDVE